ncbi:cytochrome b/b6 domain-containing protein [Motiliproteus sp.]|uniref:cytochrome b/b6 domain-containing protein n=1 Tax=Motiliproteus sp. TaxID=1898955 RepID=UPI003BA982A4
MTSMVKVWDLPTRFFHWSLVLLFVFMIVSGESDELMEWHFYGGYLLCGLILFRLIWGWLGTRYARFSSLQLNPITAAQYTRNLLRSQHRAQYGHTPAGSLMVVLMLGLLSLQLLTGMMSTDDIIWSGPLYPAVSETIAEIAGETHEVIQGLMQLLVGVHVFAILLYKLKFNEPLVPAMVHGRKPKQGDEPAREGVSLVKYLLAAIPALGLTYWLFTLPI